MHNDFNEKKWPLYSWMYNLHLKRHTIWDNSYLQNKNSDFKHRDYLSIHIAVHLAVYVFDCNVTEVPCEGVWMWSLLKICISLCQWTKNTRKYVYETENNDLRLDFQNAFHIVFLTSVLEAFKVFEFAWRVLENKPLPSHCPRKNMLYLSWALSAWATRQ